MCVLQYRKEIGWQIDRGEFGEVARLGAATTSDGTVATWQVHSGALLDCGIVKCRGFRLAVDVVMRIIGMDNVIENLT